jgi:hypothetical protein
MATAPKRQASLQPKTNDGAGSRPRRRRSAITRGWAVKIALLAWEALKT